MRQYRGLTKDGKWVYGWYVEGNCLKEKEYKRFKKSYILGEYPDLRENTIGCVSVVGLIEVIPETVGQQVGLKDKNGVEIYANDRIQWFIDNEGTKQAWIKAVDGGYIIADWIINVKKTKHSVKLQSFYPVTPREVELCRLEVIGNIHQEKKGSEK